MAQQLDASQLLQIAQQAKSGNAQPVAAGNMLNAAQLVEIAKKAKQTAKPQQKEYKQEAPNALVRFGHGMNNALGGIMQGLLYVDNKLTGNDAYDKFTAQQKENEELYQKGRADNGMSGIDGMSLAGELVATLPAGAAVKGLKGAKLASKAGARFIGQNAGVGAGIGAAHLADNTESRLGNMGAGAAGGAIGAVAGKKIGDAAVKVGNIAKSRLRADAQEIVDLGNKHGVRVSVGDAGRNAHVQRAETLLDQVPVIGTGGFRAAQHQEAKAATKKVVDSVRRQMEDTNFKAIGQIRAAAASGDRNAARIAALVDEAGDDSSRIIQAGAEVRLWRESKIAGQMYDEVGRLAKTQGGAVAPTNTQNLLNNKLGELSRSLAPDDALMRDLQVIQGRLNDATLTKDFANMRLLRSQLGDMAEGYAAGAKPNQQAAKFIGDLRKAVDDDVEGYAVNSGSPALKDAYKRADLFYKSALKNRDSNIAKALKSDKPDEIYSQFIKTGKADRAANFYRSLDPKAQAALRYEMANQALDKAINSNTQTFSPAKFAGEFERMREPYGSVFKGHDKWEMDGLIKLMRHVDRAGQYAENPPTGQRAIGAALGVGTLLNPAMAAKVGISAGTLRLLFTTNAGRRILLSASDLPAGSPKLVKLLEEAQSLGTVAGANQAQPQ